jgi:phage terminase large subunit
MIIKLNTYGNEKQKETAGYWIDKTTDEIVYGGSKGCFVAETLVNTPNGHKPIEQIKEGEIVYSWNVENKQLSVNKVLKTFVHGCSHQRKNFITFVFNNNVKLKCTENHELLYFGKWISARNVAKRKICSCKRNREQILHKYKREVVDNEMERITNYEVNETGFMRWIFENNNNYKWQEKKRKNPQACSGSIYRKQRKQITSKSLKFQHIRQLCRKFRVGNSKGKFYTLTKCRKIKRVYSWLQTKKSLHWFKSLECKINRITGFRNKTKIQATNIYTGNVSERIRRKFVNNQRCNIKTLEAREVRFSEIKEIIFTNEKLNHYDLCVENDHNYIVSENNYIVHNSGKSYLMASLIFGDAFLHPGTRYFIARKKLNDLRKHTIPTIHEVFGHWGINQSMYKYDGMDNLFRLSNGSIVLLIEAKYLPSDPLYQRFGSMQMTRGAIEEAGEFESESKAALKISCGRWLNDKYNLPLKLLMTCNPSKNFLYKDFYKANKEGTLSDFKKFVQAYPNDNKMLPAGYLENLERSLSKNEKERLLYGNWEYDDDPLTLCNYDAICDIFENIHLQPTGQRYISADIARLGSDKARIGVWDGYTLIKVVSFDKSLTTEIEACIRSLMVEYSVFRRNVIVDEDGVGGGVVDHLSCKGFINNHTQMPEKGRDLNFYNLQSQCIYRLTEAVNKSEIRITANLSDKDKEEIIEELETIKREDKEGKIRIQPKDKVKGLIGRSPDWRDMLMMRFAFDFEGGKIKSFGSTRGNQY